VLAYGETRQEAQSKVEALALRVAADRLDRDRSLTDPIAFAAV